VSSSIPEYFALFGLEPRFAIDPDGLTRAYREVLSQVHPDRHAGAGAAERRAAMQLASHANEAYRTLKSDSGRAAYLCRSNGIALDGPGAAPLAASFLERQMHWHETLEAANAAHDVAAIAELSRDVAQARSQLLTAIARLLDERADYAEAGGAVRSLLFLDKLAAEIDRAVADREESAASGT
jgi:molecular chaperone HscB